MITFLVKLILWIIVVVMIVAVLRDWELEKSKDQTAFIIGTVPKPAMDGAYKGSLPSKINTSWLGKKFDAAHDSGVNMFSSGDKTVEKYPFKTSVTKGIKDQTTEVLAIDYDIPENPFWLRPILDEVVQVSPGVYLGKMQIRIIPKYPLTLTFFNLVK